MIFGHLASAILIKRFSEDESSAGVLFGSVFPDVGDKAIKKIRGLKQGRSFFHSLFGTALTVCAAFLLLRGRWRRSFIKGYLGHIIMDAPQDVPWFYPFRPHEFSYTPYSYATKVKRQLTHPKFLETVFIFWSILIAVDGWRKKFRSKNATTPDLAPTGTAAKP